jgi:hypothetical protein
LRIDKDRPLGIEPEQPPVADPAPRPRTAVELDPSRRRDQRPYRERSDAVPIVVDAGLEIAEAASSNIVASGARAVGRGALRVGSEGLDALGSVAEFGGEVLSGAADAVGSVGEGCAGCAAVIVGVRWIPTTSPSTGANVRTWRSITGTRTSILKMGFVLEGSLAS